VYYPGDLPVISVCRKFNISSSVIYGVAELATTQVMVPTQVSFKLMFPHGVHVSEQEIFQLEITHH